MRECYEARMLHSRVTQQPAGLALDRDDRQATPSLPGLRIPIRACESPRKNRGQAPATAARAGLWSAALAVFLVFTASGAARALDPLKVVREFCRADGLGNRLSPGTLRTLGGLVAWDFEPAWDHVFLITGYEISTPRQEEGTLSLEVIYTVSAEVRAGRVRRGERLQVRTFRLRSDDSGRMWRILGPPPAPHVFVSELDAERLADSLDPQAGVFLSNSGLVWKALTEAGWSLPYMDTSDLAATSVLSAVQEPAEGDLAFYYDGDEPYHVAVVEGDGAVVSATLNGGIRRTPLDAFAGEVRFMRRGESTPSSEETPSPENSSTEGSGAEEATPEPVVTPDGT